VNIEEAGKKMKRIAIENKKAAQHIAHENMEQVRSG
jgi:hypothetical protein